MELSQQEQAWDRKYLTIVPVATVDNADSFHSSFSALSFSLLLHSSLSELFFLFLFVLSFALFSFLRAGLGLAGALTGKDGTALASGGNSQNGAEAGATNGGAAIGGGGGLGSSIGLGLAGE